MPIKDPVKRKAYHKAYIKEHYQRNKPYYKAKNHVSAEAVQAFILNAKNKPCADCGVSYPPCVMDFDHKADKKFNVGQGKKRGINVVKREIAKCEVVCANCHRLRTHAPMV